MSYVIRLLPGELPVVLCLLVHDDSGGICNSHSLLLEGGWTTMHLHRLSAFSTIRAPLVEFINTYLHTCIMPGSWLTLLGPWMLKADLGKVLAGIILHHKRLFSEELLEPLRK